MDTSKQCIPPTPMLNSKLYFVLLGCPRTATYIRNSFTWLMRILMARLGLAKRFARENFHSRFGWAQQKGIKSTFTFMHFRTSKGAGIENAELPPLFLATLSFQSYFESFTVPFGQYRLFNDVWGIM